MTPARKIEWLSKPEAAKRLGKTPRRVDQLIAEGKLRGRKVPGDAGRDITEVHAGSIEAFLGRREAVRQTGSGSLVKRLEHLAVARREEIETSTPSVSSAPPAAHLFLTLAEASAYSGRPEGELLELIRSGELPARRVKCRRDRWRVRPVDLIQLAASSGSVERHGRS